MLTRNELATRWNVSTATIKRREKDGKNGYPKPIRIGPRLLRYKEADILEYEKNRRLN
jgi:predicted DNA-binding transcriptional regulator AlpA